MPGGLEDSACPVLEVTGEETSKLLVSGWMWGKTVNCLNCEVMSKPHTCPKVMSESLTGQLDLSTTFYE